MLLQLSVKHLRRMLRQGNQEACSEIRATRVARAQRMHSGGKQAPSVVQEVSRGNAFGLHTDDHIYKGKPAGGGLFGGSAATTTGSLFGNQSSGSTPSNAAQSSNLFGGTGNASTAGSSLFGGSKPAEQTSNAFGAAGTSTASSGFGTTSKQGGRQYYSHHMKNRTFVYFFT